MTEVLKIVGQYGGFSGIVLLGAFYIIWRLWRHMEEQQKEMREMQQQMIDLQETRVQEAKDVRDELLKFSEGTNKVLGDISATLSGLKDAVLLSLKR